MQKDTDDLWRKILSIDQHVIEDVIVEEDKSNPVGLITNKDEVIIEDITEQDPDELVKEDEYVMETKAIESEVMDIDDLTTTRLLTTSDPILLQVMDFSKIEAIISKIISGEPTIVDAPIEPTK